MKIYPSDSNADEFLIRLTSLELQNLRDGVNSVNPGCGSPWSRGTVRQMDAALNDNRKYRGKVWDDSPPVAAKRERAPSGSIKPKIAELVYNGALGITAREIVDITGFKPNTVRGTLWTLRREGLIAKKGEGWYRKVCNENL